MLVLPKRLVVFFVVLLLIGCSGRQRPRGSTDLDTVDERRFPPGAMSRLRDLIGAPDNSEVRVWTLPDLAGSEARFILGGWGGEWPHSFWRLAVVVVGSAEWIVVEHPSESNAVLVFLDMESSEFVANPGRCLQLAKSLGFVSRYARLLTPADGLLPQEKQMLGLGPMELVSVEAANAARPLVVDQSYLRSLNSGAVMHVSCDQNRGMTIDTIVSGYQL